MNNKTLAMVSYVTIIGWLIAFFSYKQQNEKNTFVNYHLEQSFGVFIFSVILSVCAGIIMMIIPALSMIISLISLLPLVFMILGVINASHETMKPIPLIGKLFENRFGFIS